MEVSHVHTNHSDLFCSAVEGALASLVNACCPDFETMQLNRLEAAYSAQPIILLYYKEKLTTCEKLNNMASSHNKSGIS
jgi:hypothetical protein